MTQLSEHFSLEELTATAHRGIDNTAPAAVIAPLKTLAAALEKVRAALGHPIHITSGYRSPALNKAVGGAKNSAHMLGWAADFICPAYGPPLGVCQAISSMGMPYDQIIYEMGVWTHLSVDPLSRHQNLSMHGGHYTPGFH